MRQELILNITSRVVAIALTALPLGYALFSYDQELKSNAGSLSHQELVALISELLVSSFAEAFLIFFVFGLVFLGTIEAIAFSFRWIFGRLVASTRKTDSDWP